MARQSIHNYCLLLISIMLILSGCSKKEDVPAPPTDDMSSVTTSEKVVPQQESVSNQEAETQTVTFDKVLDLWKAGQKEQAIQSFLSIDWKRPDIFVPGSIFGISEAEFVKLPESQRLEIQQKSTETAKAIREISKYMIAQTQQTNSKVERYREALLACGRRLSGGDQLAIIQMVGKAVTGYVEKELPPGN